MRSPNKELFLLERGTYFKENYFFMITEIAANFEVVKFKVTHN